MERDPAVEPTEGAAAEPTEPEEAAAEEAAAEPVELDLEALLSERDQFKDIALRLQADFAHGADQVEPVWSALIGALQKQGLEALDLQDKPFDPSVAEAVAHEPG